MKLNLLIRGHVRSSLNDRQLLDLILDASKMYELSVFIHTWNVVQNSLSWRHIPSDETEVSESTIRDYFSEAPDLIKTVMIDDDSKIEVIGNVEGFVANTPCPMRGYKNMFYGIHKLVKHVHESSPGDELAVQMRFDIMQNSFSSEKNSIINFISTTEMKKRIRFISEHPILGVDNIFMASVSDMYKFIEYLYFNFDSLNEKHRWLWHQEHICFFESDNF